MNAPLHARRLLAPPVDGARQGFGRVIDVDGDDGDSLVETDRGLMAMRRAASCLLVFDAGDLVWWCADVSGDRTLAYVVQVLERRDPCTAAVLDLPADTTLRCERGTLRVEAPSIALEAQTLSLRATRATLLLEAAELIGGCWQAVIGALRHTGSALSSVVDSVTVIAKRQQRFTEGSDLIQAGTLDLRAATLASVTAEHVLVQGERLVKTRAAQIHMG
jgi:hypothetical protein